MKLKDQLGNDVCQNLLPLRAISGCDKDSRVYGIGKAAALKRYMPTRYTSDSKRRFSPTVDDSMVAGENTLVSLYGRKPREKLDGMLYQRYCERLVINSSQIQFQNQLSTSAVTRHHRIFIGYRIFNIFVS